VETGVFVGASRWYCFYENHTFENCPSGLKFPDAIVDNLLDSWVMKKLAGGGAALCGGIIAIQVVL